MGGKTTSIGKLAHRFKQAGKKVVLGAADTFRAAAVDQLTIWSEREQVNIVAKGMNTDPSAVAFETLQNALSEEADVVLIVTAGRLHNKVNLMNELSKIRRVLQKLVPEAPHEVLLVLDGSTGQNALEQAKQFTAATDVSGLVLTKLDGTAKGGVVIGIASNSAFLCVSLAWEREWKTCRSSMRTTLFGRSLKKAEYSFSSLPRPFC